MTPPYDPAVELAAERRTLERLERIRRVAIEEGAYGTPGLDEAIDETRAVIANLEREADASA